MSKKITRITEEMKFQKRLRDFAMMRDLQKCIDKELELIKFPPERHLKVIKGGKRND